MLICVFGDFFSWKISLENFLYRNPLRSVEMHEYNFICLARFGVNHGLFYIRISCPFKPFKPLVPTDDVKTLAALQIPVNFTFPLSTYNQ